MKDFEKTPTGLLHATDEIRKLIIDNPDLPLLVFVGNETTYDEWCYTCASKCTAQIGEVLDCEQDIVEGKVFCDKEEFEDELRYFEEDDFQGSDAEFDEYIKKIMGWYEPFWKKCIILYVEN